MGKKNHRPNPPENGGLGGIPGGLPGDVASPTSPTMPPRPAQRAAAPILEGGFAHKSRASIALMDQLRSCGASLDIDIPTICIIGNQSAGKSSVIESISGVALPRASGTCTRCPTEVCLKREDCEWRCQVSLRFERDLAGAKLAPVMEVPFGDTICLPTDVCERVQRGQLAILHNAGHDLQRFLDQPIGELTHPGGTGTSFSENLVCLSIAGRDYANLSLIDLPGMIKNVAEGEDPASPAIIKKMVESAVSRPNCLILSTISCSDDIQNQEGPQTAREFDPEGRRTIGVLTKPDTIQEGVTDEWVRILTGEKEKLRLGYYMVKNPAPKDLKAGITFEEARAAEKAFFTTPPWRNMPARSLARCGIEKLAEKLSGELEKFILSK
ncbi:unnamed protein product [Parajaminaea phylloscopi]